MNTLPGRNSQTLDEYRGLILAINAGSSSLRLSLFEQTDASLVQRAGVYHQHIRDTDAALLADFIDASESVISLVVHRVVHGGAQLTAPCLVDAAVEEKIEALIPLAPLHNPVALKWIRHAGQRLGRAVPQVAVFDTAFYHRLPEVAASYALPQALCRRYAIRRYGFHGIAHRAMLNRWRALRPEMRTGGRLISVQLGSGCSITAIDQGVAVDTSMGFSPLEGLVMATRSGDVDPAITTYLQQQAGLSAAEITQLLNKESGLLGLSGESGDMKTLLASKSAEARLAIDLYCYRIRKYIGAYLAVLGGADAILFGGGVGENSPAVREKILQNLAWLGIELDLTSNNEFVGKEGCISSAASSIEVWVMPVDEAQEMAKDAVSVINQDRQ